MQRRVQGSVLVELGQGAEIVGGDLESGLLKHAGLLAQVEEVLQCGDVRAGEGEGAAIVKGDLDLLVGVGDVAQRFQTNRAKGLDRGLRGGIVLAAIVGI